MTNIVAAIVTVIVTNWVSVGTFAPTSSGEIYDVQAGNLQANITAVIDYKEQKHAFVLESVTGPSVGQRLVPLPARQTGYSLISSNCTLELPSPPMSFFKSNAVPDVAFIATNGKALKKP